MLLKIKNKMHLYQVQFQQWLSNTLFLLDKHPIKFLLILPIILITVIEMLNRRSFIGPFLTMSQNPMIFFLSYLIVMLTLSVSLFFKRKYFVFLLISVLWIGLSVTNFIMLGYRTTPLTAIDFNLFLSVASVLKVYLTVFKMILFSSLIGIAIVFILYTYRILPKTKVNLKLALIVFVSISVSMSCIFTFAGKIGVRTDEFNNIAEAFQDYGFAYCFTTSIVDRGINEPQDYSEKVVHEVLEIIDNDISPTLSQTSNYNPMNFDQKQLIEGSINDMINTRAEDYLKNSTFTLPAPPAITRPNIVFIQLESFFDVNHLVDYEFSENPVPNFTALKESYSYGYLNVPTIGAGTANTEFEILSGMSLSFFGAGEYPYKTILQETTVESICYDLDELGYNNHAIHNNVGTFYSRNEVYPMLGFDSFNSLEFMDSIEYNPLGWAKDTILIDEIIGALTYSPEQDFIFTVSVQPHGKYPDEIINDQQFITIDLKDKTDSSIEMNEITKNNYEYFLNELYETDQFVKELLAELTDFDEPIVVVLYGDHLPSLEIEDESLVNQDKFQTEYILWSNFPMLQINKDLKAYQLSAYVMERLGMDNGILTKFHQKNSHLADYETELQLLQYDMLYGDLTVYDGTNPHLIKPMIMGYRPITITQVETKGEALIITGDYFTLWSQVLLDGEIMDTLYLDEKTLIIPYEPQTFDQQLTVAQVGNKELIMKESTPWIILAALEEE